MSQVLRVAVAGANGRLGREICAAIAAADDVEMTFVLLLVWQHLFWKAYPAMRLILMC